MTKSWDILLDEQLGRLWAARQSLRIAVMGIGHAFQGDDAVGVLIVKALQELLKPNEERMLICAGAVPENCCGTLRRFSPDLVLMIDAAQMDELPGTLRLLSHHEVSGVSASTTHTLPLHVLAGYLISELQCEISLLGIQPICVDFGEVSPLISEIVPVISQRLAAVLRGDMGEGSHHRKLAMKPDAVVNAPLGAEVLAAESERGSV